MPRYVDIDDVEVSDYVTVWDCNCSEFGRQTVMAVDDLQYLPTADVVPKSEADKWYHEYHAIKDELKQEKMYHRETEKLADRYCIGLQKAKADVAREIFEEIEKALNLSKCYGNSGIYFEHDIETDIAELKKKYTEASDEKAYGG